MESLQQAVLGFVLGVGPALLEKLIASEDAPAGLSMRQRFRLPSRAGISINLTRGRKGKCEYQGARCAGDTRGDGRG